MLSEELEEVGAVPEELEAVAVEVPEAMVTVDKLTPW